MVEPTWKETSGVDRAANLVEGWLVMKSADPHTAAVLAEAEQVAKGHNIGSTTMQLSKDARAALPAETVAYIESLEKQLKPKKMKKQSAKAAEREAFEKAVADLPEGAREVLRKSQREAAEAQAIAKAMHDQQEDAKYEAFAKSLAHVPGVTAESAKTFRKMAEENPDEWASISKTLAASENALKASGMFKEFGSGHTGTPGSAGESIEAMAKAFQDAEPSLSYPEAVAKAAEKAAIESPDLIVNHRREQLRANATPGGE